MVQTDLTLLKMADFYQVSPLVELIKSYILNLNQFMKFDAPWGLAALVCVDRLQLADCVEHLIPRLIPHYELLAKFTLWDNIILEKRSWLAS